TAGRLKARARVTARESIADVSGSSTRGRSAMDHRSHNRRRCTLFAAIAAASWLALGWPAEALAQADPGSFSMSTDIRITVGPDRTAERTETRRIKVLGPGVLENAGKQSFSYHEGREVLDVVEAYTEKPNGEKVFVDPANIITSDAQPGSALIHQRDQK